MQIWLTLSCTFNPDFLVDSGGYPSVKNSNGGRRTYFTIAFSSTQTAVDVNVI